MAFLRGLESQAERSSPPGQEERQEEAEHTGVRENKGQVGRRGRVCGECWGLGEAVGSYGTEEGEGKVSQFGQLSTGSEAGTQPGLARGPFCHQAVLKV